MTDASRSSKNWFAQGGEAYARFRPQVPLELVRYLASIARRRTLAVDVGCGNGQLTSLLAQAFTHVVGVDASEDQLAHACEHERVRYLCAPAEHIPLEAHTVDLLTVAQAAHWFDLPRFYEEVRRLASDGAALALISYGVPRLPAPLDARFQRFYTQEIGPFWPAERRLVDSGYAELAFPFDELVAPTLSIRVEWTLAEWLGYVSTWSAVRRAREAGRDDLFVTFAADLEATWGAAERKQAIEWPLALRVGRLSGER